jgi:ribosomal protein S18 acetylase RimI-like enzyme
VIESLSYLPIVREHLDGVLRLCEVEGFPSYTADRARTWAALTAPGVCTMVAVSTAGVVGFAQMQSDGVIQAHLSMIVVDRAHRRGGIGRQLVQEAFRRCGGQWVDLLSTEGADGFYQSFEHKQFPGYRLHP